MKMDEQALVIKLRETPEQVHFFGWCGGENSQVISAT